MNVKYLCAMLILLDCRPLLAEGMDSERTRLIFSAAAALSRDKAVKWLFLADPSGQQQYIPAIPGSSVLVHRALPGRMGWRLWYDWLIPRLAKKHKVELIMLTGGVAASAATIGSRTIPQCLWMPEHANPAEGTGHWPLYTARLRDSLSRAALLFCYSETDRSWLAGQGIDPGTFRVVRAWPSEEASPLSIDEKEAIKKEYTGGKEYFLADVRASDDGGITQLLKSFSLFKKRQLSNLQLLLAGRRPSPGSRLSQQLETYKYRQDIRWCERDDAGRRCAAAAYALLFPAQRKTLGIPLLDAWKAEIPVIIGTNSGFRNMAGDGVLVADMSDPAALAGHLMAVYKDEQLRRDLIRKGRSRVAAYSRQESLAEIAAAVHGVSRRSISG